MITREEKSKATVEGAAAALEGKNIGANPYGEDDERHFIWLNAWASVKLEMRKIG